MMDFRKLEELNKKASKTDIKGKPYIQVNDRVKIFRELVPNGNISSDILSMENGVVTIKTTITDENGVVLSTGFAQEKENSTFINKNSYVENCETSAVGRALGFLGIGIEESIASFEEVANAIKNQEKNNHKQNDKSEDFTFNKKLKEFCKQNKIDMKNVAFDYKLGKNSSEEDFKKALEDLQQRVIEDSLEEIVEE